MMSEVAAHTVAANTSDAEYKEWFNCKSENTLDGDTTGRAPKHINNLEYFAAVAKGMRVGTVAD